MTQNEQPRENTSALGQVILDVIGGTMYQLTREQVEAAIGPVPQVRGTMTLREYVSRVENNRKSDTFVSTLEIVFVRKDGSAFTLGDRGVEVFKGKLKEVDILYFDK